MPHTTHTYTGPPDHPIKLALRLVPLMTGWRAQDLIELANGDIDPRIILNIYKADNKVSPSEIRNYIVGNDATNDLINAIPPGWYVWSNDLIAVHHNRLIYILPEFETEAWKYAISWHPDEKMYKDAIHQCPTELLSVVIKARTARTAQRNAEIIERAERMYRNYDKPKPKKVQLCEDVVDAFNRDTPKEDHIGIETVKSLIAFKELKKKYES